jgi:hypothetical protein
MNVPHGLVSKIFCSPFDKLRANEKQCDYILEPFVLSPSKHERALAHLNRELM